MTTEEISAQRIHHIHMTGVCGVAMGSLAGMLRARGFRVTGSDEHVYPPMSDMLAGWGIEVMQGYDPAHVGRPDLAVIGNAISRGNPEAEYILDERIPYRSMAQALHEFFLEGKEVIAVAGTHGKTTTTALLAYILDSAGLSPSFFVGGVPANYNSNFGLGMGRHFVIEGDEYDSAFFEKIPKFMVYRPTHLVLTSLEFDHADIYNNLDEIMLWFRRLVNIVPAAGKIVRAASYGTLARVTERSWAPVATYGTGGSDFSWRLIRFEGDTARLALKSPTHGEFELTTLLFGDFNFQNIAAAASMALLLGVSVEDVQCGVQGFLGVRRRQELIYSRENIRVFEDFAHHPTAIAGMLAMLRGRYPGAKVHAVYEPRSATSRRNVFQDKLPGAFAAADTVLVKSPFRLEGIPEKERIDIGRVVASLRACGTDAAEFGSVEDILDSLFKAMDGAREHVVVIMSNGGFDGIYAKLVARAQARFGGRAADN
ncbi:MAG: UDP-N-acetylmuramate:L-alanyl-gamma-D-glutamyl-meso-diaminopimelate ligase [Spirochaetes bacterium]|nr:MAG: UDP-N-acetylmuramate:L-alanyl-gamma-D-glutamyl-meso-diaminopimelate ligase [Spirochaetota bacterium]